MIFNFILSPNASIALHSAFRRTGVDGWDHVTICATCEDQDRTDYRLPILLALPIKHREVICEPMLGEINMEKYLGTGLIEHVTCGGESGNNARRCDFRWIQEGSVSAAVFPLSSSRPERCL